MSTYSSHDSKKRPLDWKLLPFLFKVKQTPGFYVEAGANDGLSQSNTALLERQYGWKGLLVEPSERAFRQCVLNRSPDNIFENCALVAEESVTEVKGDFTTGNLMSSINGRRLHSDNLSTIRAKTMRQIVKDHGISSIDFMSLDVEGFELGVLQGIDLDAEWAPKVFLIEIYNWDLHTITSLLDKYYHLECNFTNYNKIDNPGWDESHNDYLFIRKS